MESNGSNIPDYEVNVVLTCAFCGDTRVMKVKNSEYMKYKKGVLIAECFPNMSVEDREMFVSHMCPKCWNDTFGDESDDE